MKHTLFLLTVLLILNACGETTANKESKQADENIEIDTIDTTKLLRHVVLFNFNDKATPDTIKKIEQAFASLKDKIKEVHSFEWGTNNSPEGLDKGLTHCFLVTFLSEADRAIYLPHPKHQEFVAMIGPYVEDVTVVDYWTK